VAAAKPERPEPGTPTPKPEPSVVKSPPRSRSRTCWRRRRATLLPLQQAELPIFFHAAPPRLLRRRVQERKVSLNPSSPCCGPGLRAEAGPSLTGSLFV
jgi:hypothetical protein